MCGCLEKKVIHTLLEKLMVKVLNIKLLMYNSMYNSDFSPTDYFICADFCSVRL